MGILSNKVIVWDMTFVNQQWKATSCFSFLLFYIRMCFICKLWMATMILNYKIMNLLNRAQWCSDMLNTPHKISTQSDNNTKNENNNRLNELNRLKIMWGFTKFYFNQMLKFLEKQKSFITNMPRDSVCCSNFSILFRKPSLKVLPSSWSFYKGASLVIIPS